MAPLVVTLPVGNPMRRRARISVGPSISSSRPASEFDILVFKKSLFECILFCGLNLFESLFEFCFLVLSVK